MDNLDPKARSLAKVLSILAAENIPRDLFRIQRRLNVQLTDFPKTDSHFDKAWMNLERSSLIKSHTDKYFNVDSTKQNAVVNAMTPEERKAALDAGVTLLSETWQWVSGSDLDANDALLLRDNEHDFKTHILRVYELLTKTPAASLQSAALLCSFGWCLLERGDITEAYEVTSFAMRTLKQWFDPSETRILEEEDEKASFWLAEGFRNLSICEAITGKGNCLDNARHLMEVTESRLETYGDSRGHNEQAAALITLGIAQMQHRPPDAGPNLESLKDAGDVDQTIIATGTSEAIKTWRKSLTLYESSESPLKDLGKLWASIHIFYAELSRGNLDVIRDEIELMKKHYESTPHLDTSRSLHGHLYRCMGKVCSAEKRCEEAESHYRCALRIFEATLPPTHHFIGDVKYDMGLLYELRQPADPEKAEDLWEEAIRIFRRNRSFCRAQLVRTLVKKGYSMRRDDYLAPAGEDLRSEAMQTRKGYAPEDKRSIWELGEADWSKHVVYWSR